MDSVGEAGALFAFMGWLTTRKEPAGPFSYYHDAASAAELVEEFRKSQGWSLPEDGWDKLLKPYPSS